MVNYMRYTHIGGREWLCAIMPFNYCVRASANSSASLSGHSAMCPATRAKGLAQMVLRHFHMGWRKWFYAMCHVTEIKGLVPMALRHFYMGLQKCLYDISDFTIKNAHRPRTREINEAVLIPGAR